MAKFVIAGVCSCPRFALAEAAAERLKATVPNFQVHKIMLDEGEPWERWLHALCVGNGWLHEESPIVWRELIQRGGRGVLIGNADDFLEYAKSYYGISISLSTLDLLQLANDNRRLHVEQSVRDKIARDAMQSYHVGVLSACYMATLMIIFQLVKDGTLGESKALILHLFCHPEHKELLVTTKNDLYDMASPYLRQVILADDMETAVRGCSLIIWLEEPFFCSKTTLYDAESTRFPDALSTQTRQNPLFDYSTLSVGDGWLDDSRATLPPAIVPNIPLPKREIHSGTISQRGFGSSSESFLINQTELHRLPSESSQDLLADRVFSLSSEQRIAAARATTRSQQHYEASTQTPKSVPSGMFSENDLRIRAHAELIGATAKTDCRILMVGDGPALNYCAYVVANACPELAQSVIAVSDIEVRARAALARKLRIRPAEVNDVMVWGDPGGDFTIDVSRATVSSFDGAIWKREAFTRRLETVFPYWKWFRRELKAQLQEESRQRQMDQTRSVAMALAHSAVKCLKRWYHDEPYVLTSVGVVSDGSYGIPKGQVMTCPVHLRKGTWMSASLELSEEMLRKLNRLVRRCAECQRRYVEKIKKEEVALSNLGT